MNNVLAWIGGIVLVALLVAVIFGIGALVTMWAWNLVMPYLFHLPQINIWIALGINILIGMIKPVISYTKKNE